MKRRVLSIFCVFALCLGAVPAAASENGAGLWVNGTDLLAEPEHTVECGSGTAEYDPENNVLTLDDAFISTAAPDGTGISASGGLTIELRQRDKRQGYDERDIRLRLCRADGRRNSER